MVDAIGVVEECDSWSDTYDPTYNRGGLVDSNAAEQQTHGSQKAAYSEKELDLSAMLDSHSCVGVHRLACQIAVGYDEIL